MSGYPATGRAIRRTEPTGRIARRRGNGSSSTELLSNHGFKSYRIVQGVKKLAML